MGLGEFAADGAGEGLADFGGGEALAKQVHEFGDGGFGGDVGAVDHSGVTKAVAGVVTAGMDASVDALGNVDYDDARFYGLADGVVKPLCCGAVAGSVGAQDDPFDAGGGELVAECGFGEAGEEVDKHHGGVHGGDGLEGAPAGRTPQGVGVIVYAEAYAAEFGVVVRFEGVEV